MASYMAFVTRMPAGVEGALSRPDEATVETQVYDAAGLTPTGFGLAVVLSGGKMAAPTAATTGAEVYGFNCRVWPSISGTLGQDFADGAPNPKESAPILVRGYMSVRCGAGTPAKGGQVYVRVQNPLDGRPVGGVEAAADGANTVAVPSCIFMGGMDANNLTEIRLWR